MVADDAVLVVEASIIAGMRMLAGHAGLVVEPSAALGIAAVLEDRVPFRLHVVTIVCASNVDVDAYHRRVGAAPPTGRPDNCSSGSRETGFTRVSSTGHSPRRPATMAMRRRLAKRTATLRDQVGVGNGSN